MSLHGLSPPATLRIPKHAANLGCFCSSNLRTYSMFFIACLIDFIDISGPIIVSCQYIPEPVMAGLAGGSAPGCGSRCPGRYAIGCAAPDVPAFIRAPRRVMIRASAALATLLTARLVEADDQARRPSPPDRPAGLFVPDLGRWVCVSPETAPPTALADAAGGGPRRRPPGRRGGLRAGGGIRHVADAEKTALGRQGLGGPR